MYCTHCGKEIDDKAVICINCGVPMHSLRTIVPANTAEPKRANSLGIAGFVISILSVWLGVLFCIPSILGLVFSIVGMANMKKYNSANGLAIAGLVLSILSLMLWTFFWVVMLGESMM